MKSWLKNALSKSRKQNDLAKNRKQRRRVFRHILLENLENRELLAGDLHTGPLTTDIGEGENTATSSVVYSKRAAATMFAPVGVNPYANASSTASATTSSATTNAAADSEATYYVPVQEVEPNQVIGTANFVPLGIGAGRNQNIQLTGGLTTGDIDVFRLSLRGGDVFGVSILGSSDISLQNASGTEIIGTDTDTSFGYSSISPLPRGLGGPSMAYVIPSDGDYYFQVMNGTAASFRSYSASLAVYRPPLESSSIAEHQILYLDFDGAIIDRSIFGAVGVARLSPLQNFLAGWGLGAQNEDAVIDAIVAQVNKKFDEVRAFGNNGNYLNGQQIGDFDIEIQNSRDNPDPWGKPNVSRVIIGGTTAELGITTIGIAESIDVGNFNTTETAVTLLDLLSAGAANPNSVNSVARDPSLSIYDVIGKLVGNITVHEAGHFFGNWHTNNANAVRSIMDSGGVTMSTLAGVGADGRLGTIDDLPDLAFIADQYAPTEFYTGTEDTLNEISWALSTGNIPTQLTGYVWSDLNSNGSRERTEQNLSGWTVFADIDGDGLVDTREPQAITAADGSYTLHLTGGQYTISAARQTGFTQTFPTTNVNLNKVGTHRVSIGRGQTVPNINFGQRPEMAIVRGMKWNDVNQDGVRQSTEAGIPNFTIYIDLDGDNQIDVGEPSAITNASGNYEIQTTYVGTYGLRESLQAGWVQTAPANAQNEYTITLVNGSVITGRDFGNSGPNYDFGDAPTGYPVLMSENGARHGVLTSFFLGAPTTLVAPAVPGINADVETDGVHDANAVGDDNTTTDDEDGVTFSKALIAGVATNEVQVRVSQGSNPAGYVSAWIDFNGDLDWNDAGEQILSGVSITEAQGLRTLTFAIPANAVTGTTYARFRYSYDRSIGPTGLASAGEVEDYQVRVVSNRPDAVNDSFSVVQNSTRNKLTVLSNDVSSTTGAISLLSVVSPTTAGGTAAINNAGTARVDDDYIEYTPLFGFVGTDTFTYSITDGSITDSATVSVTVTSAFDSPIAVDDSLTLDTLGVAKTIAVTANDFTGPNGPIRITGVTQVPNSSLQVVVNGNNLTVTAALGTTRTFEQFSYTIQDSSNPAKTSTAEVTVYIGTTAAADDKVRYSIQAVDATTNSPITSILPGQEFVLRVFAEDIRALNDPTTKNPITGADEHAVYAGFLDLLYPSNLVVPVGSPTYGVDFSAQHEQNSTVPGIIDEISGVNGGTNIAVPKFSQLLFAQRMRAVAQGQAVFTADPADISPFHDTLVYRPSQAPVTIDQITYGTTSLVIGSAAQVIFTAVDDIETGLTAGVSRSISVMANDLLGLNQPVIVSSLAGGTKGTISTNGTTVTYTPSIGTSGFDQFTYTLRNSIGVFSTATVTVEIGSNTADDIAQLRLALTDSFGNPITSIPQNGTFEVRLFAKDLRQDDGDGDPNTNPRGIAAAYLDILYPRDNAAVKTVPVSTNPKGFDITFGANYSQLSSGSASIPGFLDEVGAIANTVGNTNTPLGTNELLVFKIPMTATGAVGSTINVKGDPRDSIPFHDILLFGVNTAVSLEQLKIVVPTTGITITAAGTPEGEFHNSVNPLDVNNDGFVSAIDALIGINYLNSVGPRNLLASGASGEGESRDFIDVNGDHFHSAIDVLMVINEINRRTGGAGEGVVLDAEGEGGEPTDAAPSSILQTQSYAVTSEASKVAFADASLQLTDEETTDEDSLLTIPTTRSSAVSTPLTSTIDIRQQSTSSSNQDQTLAFASTENDSSLESVLDCVAGDIAAAWSRNS